MSKLPPRTSIEYSGLCTRIIKNYEEVNLLGHSTACQTRQLESTITHCLVYWLYSCTEQVISSRMRRTTNRLATTRYVTGFSCRACQYAPTRDWAKRPTVGERLYDFSTIGAAGARLLPLIAPGSRGLVLCRSGDLFTCYIRSK